MHLVQLLLPLQDNAGRPYPRQVLKRIPEALAARFGGVTAYTRSPAEGRWVDRAASSAEDIVVVEVKVERVDAGWWRNFREGLERELAQQEIVIRSHAIDRL